MKRILSVTQRLHHPLDRLENNSLRTPRNHGREVRGSDGRKQSGLEGTQAAAESLLSGGGLGAVRSRPPRTCTLPQPEPPAPRPATGSARGRGTLLLGFITYLAPIGLVGVCLSDETLSYSI